MRHSTTRGNETTAHRRNRAALVVAVAIVVLAALLRFEGLGRDSLWYDETGSLEYARGPISHPRHWNNGMALYHVMLHGWIRLAGESEAALRFPSALFGIAAVALLIVLVRRINGWPTALVAGLILALAWRHVYYSQEARAYSLFIMLAVLATLLLVRLLERPGTGRLIVYGIALVALAYSHYQWIFVVAFHNAAVLASRRRVGWGWLVLHGVVVLAYVPQIVLGVLPQMHASLAHMPRHPTVADALWALQDFFSLSLQQAIAGPVPGARALNRVALYLLPLVAAAGIASCALETAVRLAPRLLRRVARCAAPASSSGGGPVLTWLPPLWFGIVFVLPFLIAQTGAPVFRWRYAAGTLPVYCWLIALTVAALPRAWLRIVLAALCVMLTLPALETMKMMPMREDWRGCAETIMAGEQPGDRIVLCHFRIQRPFRTYYRGVLPITGVSRDLTDEAEITAALEWTEAPKRVWLVVSHDPTRAIIPYFMRRADYRLVRDHDEECRGITLLLLEHVPAGDAPDE